MTIALLTFAGVLVLIVGSYWVVIGRPEASTQNALRRRLRGVSRRQGPPRADILHRVKELSQIPVLNTALGRSRSMSLKTQALLDRAGMGLSVGSLFLMSACCGVGVYLIIAVGTDAQLIGVIVGFLACSIPFLYVRYRAAKRMNRFEELFPEAISLIIRALRAGHAFTTGLAMVGEEMTDPVGPEFRIVYDHQNFGMPIEEALKGLGDRIPLLDVRFFVTAVLTQREAGGNLAEVLENLGSVIRDRFKVKRQVRVVTAHARFSGAVLVLLPIACAVVMTLVAPEQMKILVTDPIGIRLVVVAVVLQIVGALAIRRIVDIEY